MSFTPRARGTRIPKHEIERRRFEMDRLALCVDGFEHVLVAADEAIDPILEHLRSERIRIARPRDRRMRDHG